MGQTVNLLAYAFGGSNPSSPTQSPNQYYHAAEVAQSVEHQLPKLKVAGSSPVFRSNLLTKTAGRQTPAVFVLHCRKRDRRSAGLPNYAGNSNKLQINYLPPAIKINQVKTLEKRLATD